MLTISPDMRRAALIRQDEAAHSRVLPDRSKFGRNRYMMTHTALGNTALPPDLAARTAQAWYEEAASLAATAVAVSDTAVSLAKAADELLNAATGAPLPARQSPLLPQGDNVLYIDFRARRQAVTR